MDRLTLLHTTDLHGARGGALERVARLRARYPDALWLDSGDAMAAPNLSLGLTLERTLERMSALGCTAMALGNREFELWPGALARKLRGARFPVVCTNLVGPERVPMPVRREVLLATAHGRPIRVLGALRSMVADAAARAVSPFRFREPLEAVAEQADGADADDLVVLLSHLGEQTDRELLARIPRLDLILGGHSHWSWLHRLGRRVAVSHPWAEERRVTRLEIDLGRLAALRAGESHTEGSGR